MSQFLLSPINGYFMFIDAQLTDFGTRDAYPTIMNVVLLGIALQATWIDLSHKALAAGIPLVKFGSVLPDSIKLDLPQPQTTTTRMPGQVIHIDLFGNCATNLIAAHLPNNKLSDQYQNIKTGVPVELFYK